MELRHFNRNLAYFFINFGGTMALKLLGKFTGLQYQKSAHRKTTGNNFSANT